jgi:hypothetical protein
MPERSKGGGQTKCSPWSCKLPVGRGPNDGTPEKFVVTKPWRRLGPTQGCSTGKEEKNHYFTDESDAPVKASRPYRRIYKLPVTPFVAKCTFRICRNLSCKL